MQRHNSVFADLTKLIDWAHFDQLVEHHRADRRVRTLPACAQLLALIFGQLSGASSLREIEAGLKSHRGRLYHAGARCVARSTLADANSTRSWEVFADLFAHMARKSSRATRRKMRDAVRIIDASRIRLSGLSAHWARFREGHTAAKLHLVFDPDADAPVNATVTPERVNDIIEARKLKLEPGATYVFDLAYYDYAFWARLHHLGCRFVTRLKGFTQLVNVQDNPVREGGDILADRTGMLPSRLARSRRNPMSAPVREITLRISTGKIIRLATNDLGAPAEEIAALYKQRWQIELFFKWIKQNLKIRTFLGTSDNAVRIQLFAALITYLLIRAAYQAQTAIPQAVTFIRLIRLNLMHRKPLNALNQPPPPIPQTSKQTQFCFHER